MYYAKPNQHLKPNSWFKQIDKKSGKNFLDSIKKCVKIIKIKKNT